MSFTSGVIGKLASWQPHEHAFAFTQSQNLVKSEDDPFSKVHANSQVFDLIFVPPFTYDICIGA